MKIPRICRPTSSSDTIWWVPFGYVGATIPQVDYRFKQLKMIIYPVRGYHIGTKWHMICQRGTSALSGMPRRGQNCANRGLIGNSRGAWPEKAHGVNHGKSAGDR